MKIFNFNGRATRMEYFIHTTLDGFVMLLLIIPIFLFTISDDPGVFSTIMNIVGILAIIAVIVSGTISEIAVTVRRFHDLDRPGGHYWRLYIPIYNFYLGLILLFSKGTPIENMHGPNPLQKE